MDILDTSAAHALLRADGQLLSLVALLPRRGDLVADRVRMLNRFRDLLTSFFPPLERSFDFPPLERSFDFAPCKGRAHSGDGARATRATPERIRCTGQARLGKWLRNRHVRNAELVATKAVQAANAQHTVLPGQVTAAAIVNELAGEILIFHP